MTTQCPMGGRQVMTGRVVLCTDNDCRVVAYAATWWEKQMFLKRSMTRGELRACPKCGMRSTMYHDGIAACASTACRVCTFTGGVVA